MEKCPFPGMDPFIETDNWQHFHMGMTMEFARQIGPQLPAHYRVSAELLVREDSDRDASEPDDRRAFKPDVAVHSTDGRSAVVAGAPTVATLTEPTREIVADWAPKQRELRIRDTRDNRLVTAIEVLSPSNKRGDGWLRHRRKVAAYKADEVNALDVDLLRGGHYSFGLDGSEWYALEEDDHREAYCVALYLPEGRIRVWDIGLLDALPRVPVPLRNPDAPVVLDLQRAFAELYTYSTYPRRTRDQLDAVRPPLAEGERAALAKYLVAA